MTIATSFGSAIGSAAAHVKHGAIVAVGGTTGFAADAYLATRDGYIAKDKELAARRAEVAAARAGMTLPTPKRQRKLVTA